MAAGGVEKVRRRPSSPSSLICCLHFPRTDGLDPVSGTLSRIFPGEMALGRAGGDHTAVMASAVPLVLARRPGSCVFWLSRTRYSSISWPGPARPLRCICMPSSSQSTTSTICNLIKFISLHHLPFPQPSTRSPNLFLLRHVSHLAQAFKGKDCSSPLMACTISSRSV